MAAASIHETTALPPTAGQDLHRLRQATTRVVGSVFFGTLLKTMRQSELKGPYGHGGRGEEVFAAQLHNLWAERAGASMHDGLSDALFDRLKNQQQRISAIRSHLTSYQR